VKYPISGGKYKTAYASSRYFFTNVNFSTSTSQLGKKLTAYRKSTGSSTIGSVYASDNVMIIGQANSRTQVMYPVSGSNSWKLGWVSGSYGSSNTSSSSSSSMLSSPVPSGCKFSRKTNDNGWTGYHDINKNVSSSTPVYAIADGTVTYKQAYRTYNGVKYLTSYGNFILFTSSDGKYTAKYCHLSSFNGVSQKISSSKTKQVSGSAGTYTLTTKTVKKGDVLGYIGKTGNASGIHLHFELYQNGSRIDPTSVISGLN
jgi:murein DD-endopeptidase MepM/ murein hydrolase activator NlpD